MAITDSETSSCGVCGKQGGEIARRDDPRRFVTVEDEQLALVAGHQIVGLARLGQRQQKIVGGVGRAFHARQQDRWPRRAS